LPIGRERRTEADRDYAGEHCRRLDTGGFFEEISTPTRDIPQFPRLCA
jgi:hypothetical protein